MKEQFVDVASLINQTQVLSDMELQAYLASMNTSDRSDFTASNVADAINSVKSVKQQRFNDMTDQIAGADNNITAAAYYIARTQDLKNMAGDIDEVAIKQLTTSDINADLAGRQYEINEWSNFNKLDTLFFMQVLFICLTFISGILFLRTSNLISAYLFTLLSFLAALLAIFTLITRSRKTSVQRDSRFWHKMRFPKQQNPYPEVDLESACTGMNNRNPMNLAQQQFLGDEMNSYLRSGGLGGSSMSALNAASTGTRMGGGGSTILPDNSPPPRRIIEDPTPATKKWYSGSTNM
jgi:hypothetical protein